MSDFYVTQSETEGEEGERSNEEGGVVEFGGLKISASKVVELFRAVEKRSTAELECLSDIHRKRHGHRKKKKHRRSYGMGESPTHGSGVSETTSDVRSTTSTNITTECRDTRRADFSKFDPSLDPELDDDQSVAAKIPTLTTRKAPPNHLKEKKLASLEKITADSIKRKQRWQHQIQQDINNVAGFSPTHSTSSTSLKHSHQPAGKPNAPLADHWTENSKTLTNNDRGGSPVPRGDRNLDSMMEVDGLGGSNDEPHLPSFRFDEDEDSDGELNSEGDIKLSILSQINKIENLLDTETLT